MKTSSTFNNFSPYKEEIVYRNTENQRHTGFDKFRQMFNFILFYFCLKFITFLTFFYIMFIFLIYLPYLIKSSVLWYFRIYGPCLISYEPGF